MSNYPDEGTDYAVQSITWITELDNIEVKNTKLIALKVPKIKYRVVMEVNYRQETYQFYENGFTPWRFTDPVLIVR